MRTARAKGLPPRVVDRRHVLRNALLPVSTIIGLQTGLLLSGAVLTETVFAWPGVGSWLEGRDLQPRLPGAPGRDPVPRDRLRRRQPARRHLVRDHQPADQAVADVSVAEIEAANVQLAPPTGGLWRDAWSRLRRNPGAIVGFFIVGTFVVIAIFAPLIAPYSPKQVNLTRSGRAAAPGRPAQHWFGVDQLGRDEFCRIVYGARYSLVIGVVAVAVGLSVGLLLGSIAGYLGGFIDSLIMRCMDVMLAIPGLLLAIGIVAAARAGPLADHDRRRHHEHPDLRAPLTRLGARAAREGLRARRAVGRRAASGRSSFAHILPNSISPVIVRARWRWRPRSSTSPASASSASARRIRARRSGGRC